MRRSALWLGLFAVLMAVGGWLSRRPPSWLDDDPLIHPFGLLEEPAGQSSTALGTAPDQPSWDAANPLSLAKASAQDLQALPGVGPVLARRILAQRDSLGGLANAADLDAVPGIGPKLLERLLPRVRFAAASPESLRSR